MSRTGQNSGIREVSRKRKVNEIFYSLQGEGAHAGMPSVFVRFSGCNLSCSFCDTDHHNGLEMTDEEIADEINKYPAGWIILTGGEPSLQIDEEFITFLKSATGKRVAIETNGTRELPEGIDWVTVSPKFGHGGENIRVSHADEIKVVDEGQELDIYFSLPCRSDDTRMYLQPCYVEGPPQREANLKRTVARVLADPRWSLSLQIHRILSIP